MLMAFLLTENPYGVISLFNLIPPLRGIMYAYGFSTNRKPLRGNSNLL